MEKIFFPLRKDKMNSKYHVGGNLPESNIQYMLQSASEYIQGTFLQNCQLATEEYIVKKMKKELQVGIIFQVEESLQLTDFFKLAISFLLFLSTIHSKDSTSQLSLYWVAKMFIVFIM